MIGSPDIGFVLFCVFMYQDGVNTANTPDSFWPISSHIDLNQAWSIIKMYRPYSRGSPFQVLVLDMEPNASAYSNVTTRVE